MIRLGTVSSEGGPFLLADARAIRAWHGGDSNDYDELCKALDAAGPTWDSHGGSAIGTLRLANAVAAPVHDVDDIGLIDLPSGVLAVLWSPENGGSVSDDDVLRGHLRPTGGLAIDGSSLLTRLPRGRYSSFADMVRVRQGTALRRFVVPRGTKF